MQHDKHIIADYLYRLASLLEAECNRQEAFKYNEDVSTINLWREADRVKDMANDFHEGTATI